MVDLATLADGVVCRGMAFIKPTCRNARLNAFWNQLLRTFQIAKTKVAHLAINFLDSLCIRRFHQLLHITLLALLFSNLFFHSER